MNRKTKRIWHRLMIMALLLTVVTTGISYAGGSVSETEGGYEVQCDGLISGKDYTVTAVRGTLSDYSIRAADILYTTQIHADASEYRLTLPLKTEADAVILLAGEIAGQRSPEVIGLIEKGKVSAHRYTVAYTDVSCTDPGYRTYTCSHCGDQVIRDVISATGHSYVCIGSREPTETEDGYAEYQCTICGDRYEVRFPHYGEPIWENPFTDVRETDWYYESVKYAAVNGLFNGTSDTTFSPNSAMTRAMLVTVLYRMEGSPSADSIQNEYSDVERDSWYENPVKWASSKGVVNGYGNGIFHPNTPVTREQMAAILYRYANQKGIPVTAQADLNAFPDSGKVSDWAKTALSWANAEKLITGSTINGTVCLAPGDQASRAQVATVLMRYRQNILNR